VTFDIAEQQIVQRGIPKEAAVALRMPRACLAAACERYGCAVETDGQAPSSAAPTRATGG
jgi:hypothetical protein